EVLGVEIDDLPFSGEGRLGDVFECRNTVFLVLVESRLDAGDAEGLELVAYGLHRGSYVASAAAADHPILRHRPVGLPRLDLGDFDTCEQPLAGAGDEFELAADLAEQAFADGQPQAGAAHPGAGRLAAREGP